MNYLELQQRANILVDKVNAYEESLVGQEIDETQILNEHKYVDIYSLRPVLKLLFGATLEEKLNRTLDNDVALRVFASTAPAWKSSFNLLSFNPGATRYDYSTLGDVPISSDGLLSSYSMSSGFNLTPRVYIDADDIPAKTKTYVTKDYPSGYKSYQLNLDNNVDFIELNTQVIITENYTSTTYYPIISKFPNAKSQQSEYYFASLITLQFNNGIISLDGYEVSFGRTFQSGDVIDINLKLYNPSDIYYFAKGDLTVTLNNSDTKTRTNPTISFSGYQNAYSILKQFIIRYSRNTRSSQGIYGYKINMNKTYMNYHRTSIPVGFETDKHEFIQNIDTYNNHNMLQLDVKQNEVTTRDDRIKKGINYSYSSNIADALVTESQVANLFAWNTTTKETIANNLITFNRQVPGIVTYYLGNDYTSEYTATIPYNPRYDTINAVNNNTPPYYGAFYRNTDYTQSQVGLNPGAECCRIFMPGCNYTRGLLESPQQIWQPDKKVGNDNYYLGYNWQGRAIYHELVFKNRRAGASDTNVDFIPTLDTIADNDPQGLATRVTLAQQKSYYKNRLWFEELDDLYGANCSKLADYITLNSISVPKLIKEYVLADFITTAGDIQIIDGIASNFSYDNRVNISQNTLNFRQAGTKFGITFTTSDNINTEQPIYWADRWLYVRIYSGNLYLTGNSIDKICSVQPNTKYYLEFDVTAEKTCNTRYSINDGDLQTGPVINVNNKINFTSTDTVLEYGYYGGAFFRGTIDLTKSFIQLPSDTAPRYLCTIVEKNKEVFNRNLFNVIGSASVSDSGTLSNTSSTSYVTADIKSIYSLGSIEFITPTFSGFSDSSSSGQMFSILSDTTDLTKRFGFEVNSFGPDQFGEVVYTFYSGTSSTAGTFDVKDNYKSIQFKITLDNTQRDESSLNSTVKVYYRVDNETEWTLIQEHTGVIYDLDYTCTIGKKDNQTTGTIELGPMKQTINDKAVFEGQSVPGTSTMNDNEFYNDYKLNYETYAKALDQPL